MSETKRKRREWAAFEYGKTPEDAQARHDDMNHQRNNGTRTWVECPAYACETSRKLMEIKMGPCPTCAGTGQVALPEQGSDDGNHESAVATQDDTAMIPNQQQEEGSKG